MGEHLHLRITHKRHVCEYMFLHKNDPLCMAYHPYHFVGEVLLHPVYMPVAVYDGCCSVAFVYRLRLKQY